jgi:hypothetical protein
MVRGTPQEVRAPQIMLVPKGTNAELFLEIFQKTHDFAVYRTHRFWPGSMNLKRPLIYLDVKPENEFPENLRKKRTDGFLLVSLQQARVKRKNEKKMNPARHQ